MDLLVVFGILVLVIGVGAWLNKTGKTSAENQQRKQNEGASKRVVEAVEKAPRTADDVAELLRDSKREL